MGIGDEAPLKLKTFCPFSYKRGAKSHLSDSSPPCLRQFWQLWSASTFGQWRGRRPPGPLMLGFAPEQDWVTTLNQLSPKTKRQRLNKNLWFIKYTNRATARWSNSLTLDKSSFPIGLLFDLVQTASDHQWLMVCFCTGKFLSFVEWQRQIVGQALKKCLF